MGKHEDSSQASSGLFPNGLLPNEAASVMRVLDSERWLKAEERTAELIACIQPNPPSEERRNAVANYVKRLLMSCFPCQIFTFGSVPLKTYLPDGDIDLTAFSANQNLKDSWAHQVRDMLEKEEKNECAEFHVKEVQYIQAEVKIIKCLVENIVVDISFNQLGGLCTLCFLDEVDTLINQNHIFKRSIILIKAWCYYESRVLGAHHGLISTYALETLVLYIFHVFNNSFAGPLEVLYRFLEFFSKFDWDKFCVSLWGPVPISSLPDVTADPPRKDAGELLLSKLFLDACEMVYTVFPAGQENQGQPFVSKHFNVIDPLRVNNNLGRSVSKGNFYRIRSAFAFGAKRLARLFDCPKDSLFAEVDQFFCNTWERHGSGQRPDAPKNDLRCLSSPDLPPGSENPKKDTCSQNQESYGLPNNLGISEQTRQEISFNHDAHVDRVQRSSKANSLGNEIQGRFFFARTRSSPELADTYSEVSSQARRTIHLESGRGQISTTEVDGGSRDLESDIMVTCAARTDDSSCAGHVSSDVDASAASNSVSNNYLDDSGSGATGEEFTSVTGEHMMNEEEQDLFNIMASSTFHGFNGQVHFPLNLGPAHVPLPFSPSMLASMGYGGKKFDNIRLIETPWGTGMQFPQGMVPSPLSHYFRDVGSASNPEDSIASSNRNLSSAEMNLVEGCQADNDFWYDLERVLPGENDIDNENFEMNRSEDKQLSTSGDYNLVASSRASNLSNSTRSQQKISQENQRATREGHVDNFQYEDSRSDEVYFDDRAANSRSLPSATRSSLRSKTSSESSREGSSRNSSKSVREIRGRKNAPSASSATYGKSKTLSELSNQVDDDNRELNPPSKAESEFTENSGSESPIHFAGHQVTDFGSAQISGSDPLIPIAPVLLGPASRKRCIDNSGIGSYAFYPTGPPVPIITMLPFCNFPTEAGTSETPTSNFREERVENGDWPQQSYSPDSVRRSTAFNLPEHNSDILNTDFLSHWKNLQYGRLCQNSRHPPVMFPSPTVVPPVYLQGRFPWDDTGRPSANMNLFTQLMSYGPQLVPVAPHQSVANRPLSVYQRFADEMPRYRSGTGTYLPNPKPVRERHSPSNRRGNYSNDRGDHRAGREGNWNVNSKSRSSGHSHNRNQAERLNTRPERLATSESHADRPWGSHGHDSLISSHRHDSLISNQTQNGPVRMNSSQSGPANAAYGMYSFPATNPGGVSSNEPTVPSVVMLYPCDHNAGYSSPAEELEFGSLRPLGFTNLSELSSLNEVGQLTGAFEGHNINGGSAQRSSQDQPPSPHFSRGH